MSTGFLLPQKNNAIILRGPKKNLLIQQFIRDVAWGELDYLVVDCPPGTGGRTPGGYATPGFRHHGRYRDHAQDVAVLDVKKSLTFCEELKMPVLGVIENVSGFVCPHCGEMVDIFKSGGGQLMAEEMKVPFLRRLPWTRLWSESGDDGMPYIVAYA